MSESLPPALRIQIPRHLVELILRKFVPLVSEVVELFNENADADGLTPRFRRWIDLYQISDWASIYYDPHAFVTQARGLALEAAILPSVLVDQPKITTWDELQPYFDQVWAAVEEIFEQDPDIEGFDDDKAEEQRILNMPESERNSYISRKCLLVKGAMVIVSNHFACMQHRKSMFRLVSEASYENIEPFLLAIQTDKNCLSAIPAFRDIALQAMISGNRSLVERIMDYRLKPAFQGGTKLRLLYMVLSMIDLMRLMDEFEKDYARFADLCQSLGVYGPEDDAVDLESFKRTVRRFKSEYLDPASVKPPIFSMTDKVSPKVCP